MKRKIISHVIPIQEYVLSRPYTENFRYYLAFVNSWNRNCIVYSIEMLCFHVIIMEYLRRCVMINFVRHCNQYHKMVFK